MAGKSRGWGRGKLNYHITVSLLQNNSDLLARQLIFNFAKLK